MGRCTSCGFEPSYPTMSCPECGGVVSAVLPAAGMPPGEGAWTPVDRTMRRTDLPPRPMATPATPGPPSATGTGSFPPSPGARPATAVPQPLPPPGRGGLPGEPPRLGARFLAWLVDQLVLTLPVVALAALPLSASDSTVATVLGIAAGMWAFAAWVLLVIVPLGRVGASLGKALLGVRVVGVATGRPLGIARALLRQVVWACLLIPCSLGLVSYVLDRSGRQRGWHEQATNSVTMSVPRLGLGAALGTVMRALRH